MATETPNRALGGLLVQDRPEDEHPLWHLKARIRRVPLTGKDHDTPGVHGLRTTWIRSKPRNLEVLPADSVQYIDPALQTMFVSARSVDEKVDLDVAGVPLTAQLHGEQKVDAVWLEKRIHAYPRGIDVPPCALHTGLLRLQPGALDGAFHNVSLVGDAPVDLESAGVVFTAQVPHLMQPTTQSLATTVRLAGDAKRGYVLELLPDRQTAANASSWRTVWNDVQLLLAASWKTAWLRADLVLPALLPKVVWPVKFKRNKLEVDWKNPRLPENLVQVRLSDQPLESQQLGPESSLLLFPRSVDIKFTDGTLSLSWLPKTAPSGIVYEWAHGEPHSSERITFGKIPLVHDTKAVLQQLRTAYEVSPEAPLTEETGFLKESRGWLELPFAPDSSRPVGDRLASPIFPSESANAQGWLRLGLRRHALHRPGADAKQVPWSLRIDAPNQFAFLLKFDLNSRVLKSATVTLDLASCALSVTGALWLAGRKPDSHDALPRIDVDPDAFFPVELKNCVPKEKEKVPFEIDGLYVEAPRLIDQRWDDQAQRWARSPSLAPDAKLLTRTTALSPGSKPVRAWFRHLRLPSIQTMPVTRSDLASTAPHASRSLQLFEATAQDLTLTGWHTLQPSLEPAQRAEFAPPAGLESRSAVLTLPGIAFESSSPDAYRYEGHYTLPVCTEPHARAGLPRDDAAETSAPTTEPEITARDRLGIVELAKERVVMGALASVRWDAMFPAVAPRKTIALVENHLAPPRTWQASASVDDSVLLDGTGGVLGKLTLTGIGANAWSATGDDLLQGPQSARARFTDDTVVVSTDSGAPVVGWSIEEQQLGDLVVDGQGLGHEMPLRLQDALLRRSIHLRHDQAAGELLSTARASTVSLPDGGQWHFGFTDLFVAAGESVWNPPAPGLLEGSVDACWTWSLDGAEGDSVSLPMGRVFRFAPAQLVEVHFSADARSVIGCTIEGSLGLGTSSAPLPGGSITRGRIVLSAAGDQLVLTSIEPVESTGFEWPLDESLSVLGVDTAILKANSVTLVGRKLKLAGIELTMNVLGDVASVQMEHASDTTLTLIPASTPDDRSLRIRKAGIDLVAARLTRVGARVCLRPGVTLELQESVDEDRTTSSSQMDWFGNTLRFNTIHVDPLARAFTLGMPLDTGLDTGLEVIPGMAAGSLQTASLAFTTAGYADGGFLLQSVFCELIADLGDGLACSHLLFGEAGAVPTDRFRFDGSVQRRSCIEWPDVAPPDLGTDDSADVEFGGRPRIAHRMAALLHDHCIDGALVDARDGGKPGLRLKKQGADASIVWLAQSGHELSWPSIPMSRKFDAAGILQVWPANLLLEAIKDIGDKFTFTASYRGNEPSSTPDFPAPGLRRIRAGGLAGLFDVDVENALATLGDAWLLVGSSSFLVPDRVDPASHLQIHLPFIALFDKSANDADNALRRALTPPQDPDRSLRMSHHDLLSNAVLIGADAAIPLSRFATPTRERVPFTTSFKGAQGASGSLLTQGFLGNKGAWQVGWHVEQFQPPGPITAPLRLPFPFPRAAVMLSALSKWPAPESPKVLSTLVAFSPGNADRHMAHTVFVEGRDAFNERSRASSSRGQQHGRADMVVGTGDGLVSFALDPSQVRQDASRSRWLAWVLARVSAPLFVVMRAYDHQVHHTPLALPRNGQPALSRTAFRLRSRALHRHDGRRTWGSGDRSDMDVAVLPRQHVQLRGTPSRSLSGDVRASRLVGTPFFVTEAATGASPWLQRSDEVIMSTADVDTQDAPPVATPGSRLVRPVVPSVRSVSQALLRLDPTLKGTRVQTAIPPVLHDRDQSDRAGAFSLARVRLLHGRPEAGNGDAVAAYAGPVTMRSTRLPRPNPLPPNDDKSPWMRPVAWYGKPESPCFVLPGRWDGISGIPADFASAPPWLLLIGKPEAEAAAPNNEEVVWNGAVRVRCVGFEAGHAHGNAAKVLMTLLINGTTPARGCLRHGSRFTPFERVRRVTLEGEDVLVFQPKADSAPIGTPRAKCVIELAFDVRQAWPQNPVEETDWTFPDAPLSTLQGLDVHSIAIEMAAPSADWFPLPLSTRTIFFDDPEYDRVLNQSIQGTSADTGPVPIRFWADRRSVTAQETLVVRSGAARMKLTAAVRRRGASEYAALSFELSEGTVSPEASLAADTPYTLPMPILANKEGALRAGDLLRLEASTDTSVTPATLFFRVTPKSSLPMPEAMYSLLAFDLMAHSAWCALHSPNPAADRLLSYRAVAKDDERKLLRRSHFRWEATEASTDSLTHTLMKTHLPSESTHVPTTGEKEAPT